MTDHNAQLRLPLRSAMVWGALNLSVGQLGGFIVFLVLARQLSPEVFGVFATAALLTDLVAVNGKYAVIDAIVIGGVKTREDRSTVFWAASAATLVCTFAIWWAGVIGEPVFGIETLAQTTGVLALTLVFIPAQAVMEAQLLGNMQVRSLAIRNMTTTIAGGIAGVATAFGPFPEWALVAQRTVQSGASVALLWIATRFWPCNASATQRAEASAFLLRAGGIWRNSLLSVAPRTVAMAAAGGILGAAAAGAYRVLERFVDMVQQLFLHPSSNLAVPSFSRRSETMLARVEQALSLLRNAALFCAPAFAGLAVLAPGVVALMLGSAYLPHAGLLSWLAISGLFSPFTALRFTLLSATGRNAALTGLLVLEALAALALIWAARSHGLQGLGVGVACIAAIGGMTGLLAIMATLKIRPRKLLGAIAPAYAGAGVMTLALLTAERFVPPATGAWAQSVDLMAHVVGGAAVYGSYLWLAHRAWVLQVIAALRSGGIGQGA